MAITLTFTTSGDGYIGKESATWAGARGAVTGSYFDTTSNTYLFIISYADLSATYYEILRSFIAFDTAGILADDTTIEAARLYVYGYAVNTKMGDVGVSLTAADFAADGTIALADFDDFGSTVLSDEISPIGGWNTFTLNATGIAAIKKTGSDHTAFGLRTNLDLENTSPIYGSLSIDFQVFSKEYSDATKKPYLEVDLPGASLKRYNGTKWENAHLKRYDGANWVDVNLKYYDGAAFQPVYTQGN